MTILDRKPKHYSTSDLIWAPAPAPSDGTVGDFNTMLLDPSHLGFGQDVIISKDGTLRSRGGLLTLAAAQTVQPLNMMQSSASVAYVGQHATGKGDLWGTTATNLTGFAALSVMGEDGNLTSQNVSADVNTYRWGSVRFPDAPGGIFAGGMFSSTFAAAVSTTMWGGAVVTSNTSTGTLNAIARGVTTINGAGTAWTSALIGSYLYASAGDYIGQVDTVSSATALTIKEGTLYQNLVAGSVNPIFKSARTMQANVYKGRITCTTTSNVVVGANTKWLNMSPNKNQPTTYCVGWHLIRLSDGAWVGVVSAITNDTTLTLGANAAVAMSNEEYILKNPAISLGVFNTYIGANSVEFYADRYWFGGLYTNRSDFVPATTNPATWCTAKMPNSLAFSKKNQPEMFDLGPNTGDIITLPNVSSYGSEIRALKATRGGMLIFRGADTYFLTGYSPETFRTIKILDDGCAGNNFVKKYKEGVIWSGTKSIYFFDGVKVVDLLENKVKKFYQDNLANTMVGNNGGSAMTNDHYLYSTVTSSITWPVANTTGLLGGITMAINMLNGAVTFFTNLMAYDSLPVNVSNGVYDDCILAGDGFPASTSSGQFFKGSKLFTESTAAADNIDAANYFTTLTGAPNLGPQVLFETIKYSLKDASRLKFFKMFLMNYMTDKSMTVMVSGTNQASGFPNTATGTVVSTVFPVNSTNSILKRIKFLIRAPSLSIRVYQTAVPIAAQSQRFKLYWYAVGGKYMRIGRAQ